MRIVTVGFNIFPVCKVKRRCIKLIFFYYGCISQFSENPFEISAEHGPPYDGPPPPRLARPPSPDGGSEADGANRLKRRLQGLGPASPDRAALVNGLSGSESEMFPFVYRTIAYFSPAYGAI